MTTPRRRPPDEAPAWQLGGPRNRSGVSEPLPEGGPAAVLRVLFVCTGNICRSAAAERIARRQLAELLGDTVGLVQVHSAGTRAVVDAPMHLHSAAAVRALGADPEAFTARQLQRPMITEADLVLTMTRAHREVALGLEPRALSRVFTLREAADLVRLIEAMPDEASPSAGGPARALTTRMAAARRSRVSDAGDDIADPVNGPPQVHQDVVQAVSDCLRPVLGRLVAGLPVPGRPAENPATTTG